MKITKYFFLAYIVFTSCNSGPDEQSATRTNRGNNIIVVTDLSNRILNDRKLSDPMIIQTITSDLKKLFQQSINFGINDKFYLTTFNDKDFKNFSDTVFRIDLTRFGNDAISRSNYLYHNIDSNSFAFDSATLNKTFFDLYTEKQKSTQLAADVWYFVHDKLTYPLIDTSEAKYDFNGNHFISKYNNYLIIITDGYIEAGRYGNSPAMKDKNKTRYLSKNIVDDFRNKFKVSGSSDYKDFFKKGDYGIIPVENPLLKDCKIIVLEMFDRSIVNGVTTQTPTDLEIMKLFWNDWLIQSGVKQSDITLRPCFPNIQDVNNELNIFFGKK